MTHAVLPPETDAPNDAAATLEEEIRPPVDIRPDNSRRTFLARAVATAAGVAGTGVLAQRMGTLRRSSASAQARLPIPGFFHTPPKDLAERWGTPSLRLARRITMGITADEAQLARARGFSGYLDYHLNPSAIDDSAVDAFVAATYPQTAMVVEQLYILAANTVLSQLQQATLFRAAFSKRQLYERMVEFWTDHFNISMRDVGYLKTVDDREVIRKHALGKFPDMLRASAHSPAMLVYLDNNISRAPRVNQNYARELLELHTLGVDGGYTQEDVNEVARCFSGWTIQGRGNFLYDPSGHDNASKIFLGQTVAAGVAGSQAGVNDGEQVLTYLANHPNTAKYISKKMIAWLLRYDPWPTQVDAVAAVYLKTGGSIPDMIRAILTLENIAAAPPKHKRPFHFVVSALRGLNPTVKGVAVISGTYLTNMGMRSFVWETPDGYPDRVSYWSGGMMQRWNYGDFVASLAAGDIVVDVAPFRITDTPDGITASINRALFGGELPAKTEARIKSYLSAAALSNTRVREALALAINSSTFQWY